MKHFALVELMYELGFCNRFRSHTVLFLLVIAMGVGMRLLVRQRRDCLVIMPSSLILYVICELIVDFESNYIYDLAFFIGEISLCFTLGFALCSLVFQIMRYCK